MLGCNVMVIQKLFDIWVGCDNMVGVLIWHVNLRSCIHACMKWVCSFKALIVRNGIMINYIQYIFSYRLLVCDTCVLVQKP